LGVDVDTFLRLKELASISDSDYVRLVAVAELPEILVAYGASEPALSGEPLLQLVKASPFYSPLPLQPPLDPELTPEQLIDVSPGAGRSVAANLPFDIVTFDAAPMVVIIQGLQAPSFVMEGDTAQFNDGTLILNVGAGRVMVRLVGPDCEWIVVGAPPDKAKQRERGKIAVYELLREPSCELGASTVAEVLGAASCSAWLREQSFRLADAPALLDRCAALGLLARLWASEDPAERQALINGSAESPPQRARRWAEALDETVQIEVAAAATALAHELIDKLDELQAAAVDGDAAALGTVARAIVHRRDDLESVACVIFMARRSLAEAEQLHAALRRCDEQATLHLTAFGLTDLRLDERLRAVSWQQPEAWWGSLAVL